MKISSKRAMTLTELLVSTIIVGIMVIGIASSDYAIRKMDRDYSRDSGLSMRTQAIAEHIRKNAVLAHGDPANPGFQMFQFNANLDNNYMCFRQDVQVTGAFTPAIYADDNWACYTRLNITGNLNDRTRLYSCTRTAAQSFGSCTAVTGTYLGSLVYNNFAAAPAGLPGLPAFGPTGFTITLVARDVPSQAPGADVSGGVLTKGTTDNPQFVIRLSVYPEMTSF